MATRGRANSKGVPRRDVNAALRALQAIDLIAAGSTYAEAAVACGYGSKGACHDAVQRELNRVVIEHVETLRKLHLRRLQQLRKVYLPKALAGDGWSHDRVLHEDEREALLMGMNRQPAETGNQSVRREYAGVPVEGV